MTAKVYIHQFSSLSAAGDNAAYREAIFADKRLPLPWIDDFAEKRIRFGQIDERYLISEKTITAFGAVTSVRSNWVITISTIMALLKK